MRKPNGALQTNNWTFKTTVGGAATPRPRSIEPFDSTKIDRDHEALAELGYRFITNIVNTPEKKAKTVEWVQKNYGQKTAYIIHGHAYDIYGNRLKDCASVWIKKSKK